MIVQRILRDEDLFTRGVPEKEFMQGVDGVHGSCTRLVGDASQLQTW